MNAVVALRPEGGGPEPNPEAEARDALCSAIEAAADAEAQLAHARAIDGEGSKLLATAESELEAFGDLDAEIGQAMATQLTARQGPELVVPPLAPEFVARKQARDGARDRAAELCQMSKALAARVVEANASVEAAKARVRLAQARLIEAVLQAHARRFVELDREVFVLRSLMTAVARLYVPGPERPRPVAMEPGVLAALQPRAPEDIQVRPYSAALLAFQNALAADPDAQFELPPPWGSPK